MRRLFLILTIMVSLLTHQAEAKKYALLIGVKYSATSLWNNLNSKNDIDLLEKTLKDSGFIVYTLTDKEATHDGILKGIGNINNYCGSGDMVWIHFSGHGQQMKDAMGDEKDHLTEAFVPCDAPKRPSDTYKGQNHLTDDEIKDALIPIRNKLSATGQLLVTFDACHSTDLSRGNNKLDGTDTLNTRGSSIVFKYGKRIIKKNKLAKNAANIIEISACKSDELNYEYKNQYGSLSYLLNKGIKKQGKNINFLKLAEFVTKKANYKPIMPNQTPHYQILKK